MSIYLPAGTFELPGDGVVFDSLGDGSLITSDGTQVMKETAPGSREFANLGTVESGPPTFLRISPNFSSAAAGHYQTANKNVVTFRTSDASGAKEFATDNFDSEWLDDRYLAITAAPPISSPKAIVLVLDTQSGSLSTLVKNVGIASGGVTLDKKNEWLFVGDGLSPGGGDVTGQIKAFPKPLWTVALTSGRALDFDASGITVATILSAAALGFDGFGNLHVGGGDYISGDKGYVGVIAADAIRSAIAGGPPVTHNSPPSILQKLDPSPADNFWLVNANRVLSELYLNDVGSRTVYVFTPA